MVDNQSDGLSVTACYYICFDAEFVFQMER